MLYMPKKPIDMITQHSDVENLCEVFVSRHLAIIYKNWLNQGKFPWALKKSNLTPIHKEGVRL